MYVYLELIVTARSWLKDTQLSDPTALSSQSAGIRKVSSSSLGCMCMLTDVKSNNNKYFSHYIHLSTSHFLDHELSKLVKALCLSTLYVCGSPTNNQPIVSNGLSHMSFLSLISNKTFLKTWA